MSHHNGNYVYPFPSLNNKIVTTPTVNINVFKPTLVKDFPITTEQVNTYLAANGTSTFTVDGVNYSIKQFVKNIINNFSNKQLYLVTLNGISQEVADKITVRKGKLIYTDSKGNETNITSKKQLKAI